MTPDTHPRKLTAAELLELDRNFRPEDYGFPPPLTKAQGEARRQADLAMNEQYAGQHVAYIDTWTGDTLDRTVVAAARTSDEFSDQYRRLTPDVRRRAEIRHIRDPDEGIFVPYFTLE